MNLELPAPPVPVDCDLRTFGDMPLGVVTLRDSETAAVVTDAEFRAAVILWCACWHQIPASSLPNDDRQIARLAGYGRDLRGWKRVRAGALRGFELCSDGRLYHGTVAIKALKAWASKNSQSAKSNKRWKIDKPLENNNTDDAAALPVAKPVDIPKKSRGISRGNPTDLKGYNPSISPNSEFPAGSGVNADATPDRPATLREMGLNPRAVGTNPRSLGTNPRANVEHSSHGVTIEPEIVEHLMPSGAKISITRFGSVDEIWAPRDCPQTMLTSAEAIAIRTRIIAGATSEQINADRERDDLERDGQTALLV